MHRIAGAAVAATIAVAAASGGRSRDVAPPAPMIAVTVDDLPIHGPLPPGRTRSGVIADLVRAFRAEGVPAFGFFNAGIGAAEVGRDEAVAAWRSAGLRLGNHGYAHLNLDRVGSERFLADVDRNAAPLAAAAPPGSDWRWFRYPFLAEGRDQSQRDTVRAGLRERGYRVAAVTMSFDDFDWQAPYAACLARRDRRSVRRLEDGFLADARTAAMAARRAARARVGRDVPYILLLHAGAMDAAMMPRLLRQYRRMGFRFVTLEQAAADPFYAAAIDLSQPGPTPALSPPALTGPIPSCT